MEYPMRKNERALSQEEAEEILRNGGYGVLSTCGEDGEPYGVPVSYVFDGNMICFHCAPHAGHKLANIAENPRVCFTVVGDVCTLPAQFSTRYASVVAFGEAFALEGDGKREALRALVVKYSPDYIPEGEAYIARAFNKVAVYGIAVSRMTAKGRR